MLFAHSGSPTQLSISTDLIVNFYLLTMTVALIVFTRQIQSRTGVAAELRPSISDSDRKYTGSVLSLLSWITLIWTFALLAIAISDDPFGLVNRQLQVFWFGLLMIVPIVGNIWSAVTPSRSIATAIESKRELQLPAWIAAATAFAFQLFFFVGDFNAAVFIAAYFVLIVTCLMVFGRPDSDPLVDVFRAISPKTYGISWQVIAVLSGGILFSVIRQESWWVKNMVKSSQVERILADAAGFVICISIVAGLTVLLAVISNKLSNITRSDFFSLATLAIVPTLCALFIASYLPLVLGSIQELHLVAWDPLGKGWRLGDQQGITGVQILGAWVDWVKVIALFVGPVVTMFLVARKTGRTNIASAVVLMIVTGCIGYGGLHYLAGL